MALAVQSNLAGRPDSWVPARWQGGPLELQRRAQEKTLPADPSLRETILRWLIARVVIVGCGHGLRYVFEVRV